MVTFILNNKLISTEKPTGSSLLDLIRYDTDLPGTKIGCREGDCGACTVLEGVLKNKKVSYKSIVSCLTPIGNVHGKHVVTVEGINMLHLSPVQNAIAENGATQCGFCTPGFVMSLTGHCLAEESSDEPKAIASVSGNICRCTGYKSIEKAAARSELLKDKTVEDPVGWLVNGRFLPEYFLKIPDRLSAIQNHNDNSISNGTIIAGGTDLMVQNPDQLNESNINSFQERDDLKGITEENGICRIGASTTVTEIEHSDIINKCIPEISSFLKLVSSEPVRNMATLAGNIVNASPIGDLTILFLALNAQADISGLLIERTIPLSNFYEGYKLLSLTKDEYLRSVIFTLPKKHALINFEKVSKRTHLDIASVNSAIQIIMDGKIINECYLSAGGVSPVPLFLTKTCEFLNGKNISAETILEGSDIMQGEIKPISDVRGSEDYKRLLLRQLFFAHFIKFFPGTLKLSDIMKLKK